VELVFIETQKSRQVTGSVTDSKLRREWVALRHTDEAVVNAELLAIAGPSFDGLPYSSHKIDPLGGGVWLCEVMYEFRIPDAPENQDDTEALGPSYAVDITAGSQHITQSLATLRGVATGINLTMHPSSPFRMRPEGTIAPSAADVGKQVTITGGTGWTLGTYTISAFDNGYWVVASSPAAPGTSGGRFWTTAVPNYNQAIGVTKDRVEGTDKFVPKFEFSITVKTYPVTLEFLRTVRSIVGKTNDAAWRGFAAGELLYMGMTGQCEPNNFWTLTHKFAAGENLTVQVTPDLKIDKGAWEYLWCTYQQTVLNGVALQVPRAAYVEKIYDSVDFNTLRLNPPVCNWTSDVYGGMHPLTVAFTDLSTGTPLEWLWTFGDGTTSSLRNPVKTYMIPGTYTVSLTVTNGAGSSFKTVANYVTVS
jgi:hypothetical protein